MVLRTLINALYTPNIWQNRLDDNIGLVIVLLGVTVVAVHFIIRHINPPLKEDH
jgi:hypothetical protein